MNIKKIRTFLIILLVIAVSFPMFSYAASDYSVTSGISTIDEGKSYTVKINAKGMTGRFNISSTNASTSASSVWVENGVPDSTITVTPKGSGKVTVTYTPDSVANSSSGDVLNLSSKTDTVTVKSKKSSSEKSSSKNDTSKKSSSSEKTTTSSTTNTKKTDTTTKEEETTKPSFSSTNETLATISH